MVTTAASDVGRRIALLRRRLGRYAHLRPGHLREAVERLDQPAGGVELARNYPGPSASGPAGDQHAAAGAAEVLDDHGGAGRGNRTPTPRGAPDFESGASA